MAPELHPRWRSLGALVVLLLVGLALAGRAVAQTGPARVLAYVNGDNIDGNFPKNYESVTTDWEEYEQPAVSPNGQTIAYVHTFLSSGVWFRNTEIVRINADGSGAQRLTNNDLWESWPTWSPDGTRLAFAAGDLYVMPVTAAGGDVPVRLTTGTLYPENLAWSPDGTRLAFNSRPTCAQAPECEYAAELYVVTVAGGHLTRLTDNDQYDGDPTWSPDGAQLAYESRPTPDGDRHLYRVAAAGDPAKPVVAAADSADPTWSPDGARIAYATRQGIKTVRPDGTAQLAITEDTGAYVFDPLWTADGRRLTFLNLELFSCGHSSCYEESLLRVDVDSGHIDLLSEPDFSYTPEPLMWSATDHLVAYILLTDSVLYARDLSGSSPGPARQLTSDAPINAAPAWSPDGRRLVFSSRRDFNYNIDIIDSDGTQRQALTTHSGNDWNPSWSSDEEIAFTSHRDGNWEL